MQTLYTYKYNDIRKEQLDNSRSDLHMYEIDE